MTPMTLHKIMRALGWQYISFTLGWYHPDTNRKYSSSIDPNYDELNDADALFVLGEMAKNPPKVSKYDSVVSDKTIPSLAIEFPTTDDFCYNLRWQYDNGEHHCNGTATLGNLSSGDKYLGVAVIELARQQFGLNA